MASSRRTGTSESVSTYGSGQDYTALATWEAATDNDNVTGTVSPVLACLAAQYADSIAMGGSTNNATYFRIIRPQAGNFHTGVRDTGVRFYITTDADVMSLQESNSQIQDIVAKVNVSSATIRVAFHHTVAGTNKAFVGCIAVACTNPGAQSGNGFRINTNTTSGFFINCLSDNCEDVQFLVANTSTGTFYNCTAIGGTHGFSRGAGTFNAKNCLAHGTATADFSGTITKTNCASEDATADGTAPQASSTFVFVNAGANNYHIATSDPDAKNNGVDLSADGTYAFDDDIDRETRGGAWDIGFDELIETAIPVWMNQYRQRWR